MSTKDPELSNDPDLIHDPRFLERDTTLAIDDRARQELAEARSSGRSRWYMALAMLVLLTEQTAIGFTLIAPALTDLAVKYETTQIVWTISAFTMAGAIFTPIVGKLGDQFGKHKVLVIAAVIAVIGAVISALAPSFEILIVGRVLSSFSVAFLPVAYALIRDVFPADMRDLSISIATNGVGFISIAGPFIAGVLIDGFSAVAVFWFIAIVSAIGAAGTLFLVPETPIRDASKFDIPGIVGLTLSMVMLLVGISRIEAWGLTDTRTLGFLGGGLLVLGLWWRWESHQAEPFVSVHLLTNRATASVVFAGALAGSAGTVSRRTFRVSCRRRENSVSTMVSASMRKVLLCT